MTYWHLIWLIPSLIFSAGSYLPLVNSQHWFYRGFDYVRVQLLVILIFLFIAGLFIEMTFSIIIITTLILLLTSILLNFYILFPYFSLTRKRTKPSPHSISLLSMNVMQKNKSYDKVINTIRNIDADIILTTESDMLWENALQEIENEYKHVVKVPKNNRYGMHLYTNLRLLDYNVHYLISQEHPSIEVSLLDTNGNKFIIWGIHPPPPSPSEKPTSRQKEGELMQLAKMIYNTEIPVVVAGDFNNVSWSKISKLFLKITNLKDARLGRGFNGTFPAKYPLLRFPIDLLFHSKIITINNLKVLSSVDSDHLPLFSKFSISDEDLESKEKLSSELKETMHNKIKKGKKAAVTEN